MKQLVLFLTFFAMSNQASAMIYQCYKGSLKLENGEEKQVRISRFYLNPRRAEGRYFFEAFVIGSGRWQSSGKLVENNVLAFNSNDDYIPGGNACSNEDITLTFKGKRAVGTYFHYGFPNCDGYGGPRNGSEEFLLNKGNFSLKAAPCF